MRKLLGSIRVTSLYIFVNLNDTAAIIIHEKWGSLYPFSFLFFSEGQRQSHSIPSQEKNHGEKGLKSSEEKKRKKKKRKTGESWRRQRGIPHGASKGPTQFIHSLFFFFEA